MHFRIADGAGGRRLPHLLLDQRHYVRARVVSDGRLIELFQQLPPLVSTQQLQLRHARLPTTRYHRTQQAFVMRQQPPRRPRREQLRVVLQPQLQRPTRSLFHLQRQVVTRRLRFDSFRLQLQPRQLQLRPRRILQRQHHLKHRRMTQTPPHSQLFHQPLKRHLLMLVRRQRRLPHLRH